MVQTKANDAKKSAPMDPVQAQRDPTSNGRNPITGRWADGNPGGPGNPFVKKISELRAAVHDVVGRDQIASVFYNALKIAQGERDASASEQIAAARFVTEYAIGKPRSNDLDVELPSGFRVIFTRDDARVRE